MTSEINSCSAARRLSAACWWIGLPLLMAGRAGHRPSVTCGQDVFAGSEVLWKICARRSSVHRPTRGRRPDLHRHQRHEPRPSGRARARGAASSCVWTEPRDRRVWQLPIPRYMPGVDSAVSLRPVDVRDLFLPGGGRRPAVCGRSARRRAVHRSGGPGERQRRARSSRRSLHGDRRGLGLSAWHRPMATSSGDST